MSETNQPDQVLLDRLRAARKQRGLTQEDVAERLDIARTTVVAIEKGERPLSADELVKMGALYGVPVNELLRTIPPPADFTIEFRVADRKRSVANQLEQAAALLQELADDYVELEKITGARVDPASYPRAVAPAGKPDHFAQVLAADERNRLGLGDAPVLKLRELLDSDVGIRSFFLSLPSAVAGLYIYSDLHGPCVAVNADHPNERQRWSLAHEYAHFLISRARAEVTLLQGYARVPAKERIADEFAKAFLIPPSRLSRRFHEMQRARDRIVPADVLLLASYFEVSFQAITLALEDARLLPSGTLERLSSAGFQPEKGREILDLGITEPDRRLLPPRYERLSVEAYWAGDLSEGELAAFLHTDRVSARRRVRELSRGLSLDDAGEPSEVDLAALTELDLSLAKQ
jgi:Zn-dependent peptidase ImmA (M78 family)/DNA-binding XRE family transcriptional regulator